MTSSLNDWIEGFNDILPEHIAQTFQPLREAIEAAFRSRPACHDNTLDQPDDAERLVDDQLATDNRRLKQQLKKQQAAMFGSSSEKSRLLNSVRLSGDVGEGEVDPDDQHGAEASSDPTDGAALASTSTPPSSGHRAKRRSSAGRRASPLPITLPRLREVFDVDGCCKTCNGELRHVKDDTTERLKAQPKWVVVEEVNKKHACRSCRAFVQKPTPNRLLQKSRYDLSFWAEVIVAKYVEATPLYRQEEQFARLGIKIARSTLSRNMTGISTHLDPLMEALKAYVLSGRTLDADETTVPVLRPGLGRTATGQAWCYLHDDRRWAPSNPAAVIFDYKPSRSGVHPKEFLDGFSGKLMTDGYAGYNILFDQGGGERTGIDRVNCNAHARRKFVEADKVAPSPLARQVIDLYGRIYRVERDLVGMAPDERRRLRRERQRPLFDELCYELEATAGQVDRKSPLGTAIRYFLERRVLLTCFIDDGELEIDNNMLENLIRKVALVRKNALFAGSPEGAQAWMVFASLVGTCEVNKVDPWSYFNWLFRMMDAPHRRSQYMAFLPWHCPHGRR